jgi:hypothetical protein
MGHLGENHSDKTAGTGHPGWVSLDRTELSGHESRDKRIGTAKSERQTG